MFLCRLCSVCQIGDTTLQRSKIEFVRARARLRCLFRYLAFSSRHSFQFSKDIKKTLNALGFNFLIFFFILTLSKF